MLYALLVEVDAPKLEPCDAFFCHPLLAVRLALLLRFALLLDAPWLALLVLLVLVVPVPLVATVLPAVVPVVLPTVGLLVHYRGWLVPTNPLPAGPMFRYNLPAGPG